MSGKVTWAAGHVLQGEVVPGLVWWDLQLQAGRGSWKEALVKLSGLQKQCKPTRRKAQRQESREGTVGERGRRRGWERDSESVRSEGNFMHTCTRIYIYI